MSQSVPIPPPGFDDLSIDDRVDYVNSLWDRIAADPEKVSVPQWHRETLLERLDSHRSDPDAGSDWPTVRERIKKLLEGHTSS